jgi:hypothetical protein
MFSYKDALFTKINFSPLTNRVHPQPRFPDFARISEMATIPFRSIILRNRPMAGR